jgi:anti-anti-sigma factor
MRGVDMEPRVLPLDVDQVPFFDAFLSYASKDRALVEDLARRLAQDRLDVFLDSWFIQPGHHIPKVLLAALRKSRKVVALMTPNYFQSKWTEFELNWNFVETHLGEAGADTLLIPVMLRSCEIPKETKALRRIDLVGADWEPGYRELVTVLCRAESFVVEAYRVPAGPRSRYFGDFIASKLRLFFDFPEARVADFVTVYGELVQNALAHVEEKANRVEVSVRAHASHVVLEVSDAGPGFDLTATIRTSRALVEGDPSFVGLRGVQLADALCDRLSNGFRDQRHVVTAVIYGERITKEASGSAPSSSPETDDRLRSSWFPEARGPWFTRFVDPAGRYVYLAVRLNRVDHHNASDLKRFFDASLEGRSFPGIILDCSDVEYIASVGLRELMLVAKRARRSGGRCALIVRSPAVEEIIRISRFDLVFDVVHSLDEALRTIA